MKPIKPDPIASASAFEHTNKILALEEFEPGEKSQALDRRIVNGDPLDEWTATVMRNIKRMSTDEAYRLSIAKYLS